MIICKNVLFFFALVLCYYFYEKWKHLLVSNIKINLSREDRSFNATGYGQAATDAGVCHRRARLARQNFWSSASFRATDALPVTFSRKTSFQLTPHLRPLSGRSRKVHGQRPSLRRNVFPPQISNWWHRMRSAEQMRHLANAGEMSFPLVNIVERLGWKQRRNHSFPSHREDQTNRRVNS